MCPVTKFLSYEPGPDERDSGPGACARSRQRDLTELARRGVCALTAQTDESLDTYWATFYLSIAAIILFGGIIAPTLELSMGLG